MCKDCKEIEGHVVANKGYIYICACSHRIGWDVQDFPNWNSKYNKRSFMVCHGCKNVRYTLRQHYTQLSKHFILGGAL